MLDLKFVRENPDIVKQNIKNKFQDRKLPLVDEVIELDAKARATQTEADELRANRNKLSKQIGALMAQGKKEEAEAVKADDYTGNWTVDRTGLKNCHIMLSTMIDSKMYDCFSIYPGDDSYNGKGYWFLTAPKVVYSTDDVNEIEASATYDSVQQKTQRAWIEQI